MKRTKILHRTLVALCASALVAMAAPGWAGEKSPKSGITAKPAAGHETVEFFAGMESGEIEVTFIAKSTKQANVLIKNKSKKPLSVKLPEAFAGVPVNAQIGGMGGGMGGMGGGMGGMGGGGMGGGGGQGLGGGMGGGGMGGGGMGGMGGGGMGGGGGGFFNVAPDKIRKLNVNVVCLEEGKPDPTPRMAYRIVPIESFTDKAEVVELCKMVGRGELPQNTAQAAAWHLASGLTWQELAAKVKTRSATTGFATKYFNEQEIQLAAQAAAESARRAEAQAEKTGPESTPLRPKSAANSQASL